MRVKLDVRVDGKPLTGAFWSRLVSLTVTDREGERSDSLQIELNDSKPFLSIPRKGALITVYMGYETALGFMGAFTADDVNITCLPYTMTISGKAADMRSSLKSQKERHWDNKQLGNIVSQIAGEHGLKASVASEFAGFQYDWIGQTNVSDLHFLKSLARRHNALFTIKDSTIVFAQKGAGQAGSGAALGAVTITPDRIVPGTCTVSFTDQPKFKSVKAVYQDRDEAVRKTIQVEADPAAEASYQLRHSYASEGEADKAAQSKAKELSRSADTTSVTVPGDPGIKAGMPMSYAGVRPGVDGVAFIIDTATHSYSKTAGYLTAISAKAKS